MKVYHVLTHTLDTADHPELQGHPERFAEYVGHPNRLVSQLMKHDKKKRFEHVMVNLSKTMKSDRLALTHTDGYEQLLFRTASLRDPLEFSLPLVRFIRENKGMLHIHGISSYLFETMVPFIFNKPTVAHVRGGNLTPRSFPILFPKYTFLAPLALRAPQYLFVQNRLRMEWYAKYYFVPREKMKYTPNGIELSEFRPDAGAAASLKKERGIRAGDTVLLFAGHIVERKGVYELHEAFRILQREFPDLKLVFCGSGAATDSLRGEGIVFSQGRVPFRKMMAYYGMADIFVLPTHYDSFPNTVLEAMANGLPAVSTTTEGALDMVVDGKTGFLVAPRDGKALTERLRQLISNEALRKRMGANARKRAEEEFGWKRTAETVLRVYEELGERFNLQ